jgi:hypothetical protein
MAGVAAGAAEAVSTHEPTPEVPAESVEDALRRFISELVSERTRLMAERDAFSAALTQATTDADVMNIIVGCFDIVDGSLVQVADLNLTDLTWPRVQEAVERAKARAVVTP